MKILKFGGSSVSSPDRIRTVARIVLSASKEERIVVVVSAFQGVTNQLLEAARLAAGGDPQYTELFETVATRHRSACEALVSGRARTNVARDIDSLLDELRDALHGIELLRYAPPRALDLVASAGERLSSHILSSYIHQFHPSCAVDTRGLVITDDQFTAATVLFAKTNKAIRERFTQLSGRQIPVATGFIGATEDGRTTTIGRNGSDYTAAIIGAALHASVIEIWTDVDGVLSADPRAVSSAFVLPHLTYEEAMELSYFGASVLHSATIAPAVATGIPILIKNTLNPSAHGTLISHRAEKHEGVAKGITSVENLTLLTLRGLSMVGVPGTAERLFRSLASHHVNVILISQASSEHTICFAVRSMDAPRASKAIAQEFRFELQQGLTAIDEKPRQSIVAIVGEGMRGTPGVAGKVFQSLGQKNINISAIAQGASERNISCVVDSAQQTRALNVIHQAFFERQVRLALVVVGVGQIGSALLRQLHQQHSFLLGQGFDVRVCGIADSKRFVLNADGLNLSHWKEELSHGGHPMNLRALAQQMSALELTNVVLVDCTADQGVVDTYPLFVGANMHIITPNKKANVLPWKKYRALTALVAKRQRHFLFEANVGAGLPVISTLHDLIASGDVVLRIEGILSGTLSYLFNTFDGSVPFSLIVKEAQERGFTEPDLREDLSARDVARKLLILARTIGLKLDLKQIEVDNLVPPALRRGAFAANFFSRCSSLDRAMLERLTTAQSHGNVLRFVGVVEHGKASARVREFPTDHPFASARGSDNMIAFTTHRYSQTPLVIQGPGAGADLTAMGVFSDILKLLHYLPH